MRRFAPVLAVLAALLAPATATAQAPDAVKFLRYAAIANDGTIAFTYHDDIWLANQDGSNPRRLTANIARDFQPRFSPDGRTIAFTSDRSTASHPRANKVFSSSITYSGFPPVTSYTRAENRRAPSG